jgi:hypothetical protein
MKVMKALSQRLPMFLWKIIGIKQGRIFKGGE